MMTTQARPPQQAPAVQGPWGVAADVGLGVVCGLLAGLLFRWRSHWSLLDLTVPYQYFADSITYGNAVFNAQQGHPFSSDTLGGAGGQQLGLSSYGFEWTAAWAAAHFGSPNSGPWLAMYRYWEFSYFAVGVTTYLSLRWLSLTRPASMVAAIGVALIPHLSSFDRFFYVSFASLPLVVAAAIRLAAGASFGSLTPAWVRLSGRRRSAAGAALAFACLAMGMLGASYYMIFSFLILGSASVVLVVRQRWWPRAVRMAVLTMFAAVPLAVSYLPILVAQVQASLGPEESQSDRRSFASYANGGDPFALLAPMRQGIVASWLDGSQTVGQFFDEYGSTPITTGSEYVFYRGGVAVVGALLVIALGLVGAHRRDDLLRRVSPMTAVHKATVLVLGLAILWYSRGGLGTLIGFVIPQVRGYARAALLVTCVSTVLLVVVASQRRGVWWPVRLLAMTIICLSAVESVSANLPIAQAQKDLVVPVTTGLSQSNGFGLELRSLSPGRTQDLVGEATKLLPGGCTVLTLPLVKYPVDFGLGVQSYFAYEQLKPGLLPSDLHWTGGGFAGTPSNAFVDRWLKPYGAGDVSGVLAASDAQGDCGTLLFSSMQDLFYQAGRPGVVATTNGSDLDGPIAMSSGQRSRFKMSADAVEAKLTARYGPPCYVDQMAAVTLFCHG